MPFTPFHLGPGAAFKAIGGTHFSFLVFGGTQVLMDIEPGVRLILGTEILHGYTHTLAGAVVIGALGVATGKPVTDWVLKRSGLAHAPLTWTATAAGAFIGSFSHVFLDALMHPDMHPLWPLSDANPWLAIVTLDQLHYGCAALGVIGGLVAGARLWWRRRK